MNQPKSPFGMPQFDPSQMDPKVMMELSALIRELPPEKLNEMQSLMHNAMAGFDVTKQMEEFERSLPPGFREKVTRLMGGGMPGFSVTPPGAGMAPEQAPIKALAEPVSAEDMDLHQARLTILRAVAEGTVSPEEAEKLLFRD